MSKRSRKKWFYRFQFKKSLALSAILLMLVTGMILSFSLKTESSTITGAATAVNSEPLHAVSATAVPETDILVWQGQYFQGTEFKKGTFEFNFTVFDAKVGGGAMLF